MSDQSGIGWTDATWNCLVGCSKVSEGCRHCYPMPLASRLARMGQAKYEGITTGFGSDARWTGVVRFVPEALDLPLRWKKPRRIFVNSMSDLFHEKVADEWIDRIFAVMALCPQHTFQVLTKRPERMRAYVTDARQDAVWSRCSELVGKRQYDDAMHWPLPNVHLGVSVEHQAAADERIPLLLQTPAAVRFLSVEPLLGPVDLRNVIYSGLVAIDTLSRPVLVGCPVPHEPDEKGRNGLDWIIVGGESGLGHRTMDVAWLRSVVEQCRAAGVPVFVKQDSGPKPGQQGRIPHDLWIHEFPTVVQR